MAESESEKLERAYSTFHEFASCDEDCDEIMINNWTLMARSDKGPNPLVKNKGKARINFFY